MDDFVDANANVIHDDPQPNQEEYTFNNFVRALKYALQIGVGYVNSYFGGTHHGNRRPSFLDSLFGKKNAPAQRVAGIPLISEEERTLWQNEWELALAKTESESFQWIAIFLSVSLVVIVTLKYRAHRRDLRSIRQLRTRLIAWQSFGDQNREQREEDERVLSKVMERIDPVEAFEIFHDETEQRLRQTEQQVRQALAPPPPPPPGDEAHARLHEDQMREVRDMVLRELSNQNVGHPELQREEHEGRPGEAVRQERNGDGNRDGPPPEDEAHMRRHDELMQDARDAVPQDSSDESVGTQDEQREQREDGPAEMMQQTRVEDRDTNTPLNFDALVRAYQELMQEFSDRMPRGVSHEGTEGQRERYGVPLGRVGQEIAGSAGQPSDTSDESVVEQRQEHQSRPDQTSRQTLFEDENVPPLNLDGGSVLEQRQGHQSRPEETLLLFDDPPPPPYEEHARPREDYPPPYEGHDARFPRDGWRHGLWALGQNQTNQESDQRQRPQYREDESYDTGDRAERIDEGEQYPELDRRYENGFGGANSGPSGFVFGSWARRRGSQRRGF